MSDLTTALRAGDIERDATAEQLRAAYAEGRLSDPELEERLGRALSARTLAELGPLTADLPPARQPRVAPASRSHSPGQAIIWSAWVLAVSVNVVIWALVSLGAQEWVYFWPAWVAGPWGVVLLSRTFGRHSGRGWCGAARPG